MSLAPMASNSLLALVLCLALLLISTDALAPKVHPVHVACQVMMILMAFLVPRVLVVQQAQMALARGPEGPPRPPGGDGTPSSEWTHDKKDTPITVGYDWREFCVDPHRLEDSIIICTKTVGLWHFAFPKTGSVINYDVHFQSYIVTRPHTSQALPHLVSAVPPTASRNLCMLFCTSQMTTFLIF